MSPPSLDRSIPPYSVVAFNFATDSENKIHDDEVARRLGFARGLVPGVADYAYMTRPVVDAWGRDWLDHGNLSARFVRPVYDGDRVTVDARPAAGSSERLELELRDSSGELCATGVAGLDARLEPVDPASLPGLELPPFDARPEARLANMPCGMPLGELVVSAEELKRTLPEQYRDDLEIYRDPEALLHPAAIPHLANQILSHNVRLGPWIHTASETQHFALTAAGERLVLRGRVVEAYEKRGHETVVLDLTLIDEQDRPLARILHTAIIRPRQAVG